MLYDPRWEKREPEPPRPPAPTPAGDRAWFAVCAFLPVLIVSETMAAHYRNLALLLLPVAVHVCVVAWMARPFMKAESRRRRRKKAPSGLNRRTEPEAASETSGTRRHHVGVERRGANRGLEFFLSNRNRGAVGDCRADDGSNGVR